MLKVISFGITLYQWTVSPDHSAVGRYFYPYGCCRFTPTCSVYAKAAVAEYKWLGLWYAFRRLVRCHPWAKGGSDPVEAIKQ
ncbi:MAG: membrane protein insertion efficiency factor YidD [Patescibacteria group bacterium]